MQRFKVGDKVRIVAGCSPHPIAPLLGVSCRAALENIGREGKITSITEGREIPQTCYIVHVPNSNRGPWFIADPVLHPDEIECLAEWLEPVLRDPVQAFVQRMEELPPLPEREIPQVREFEEWIKTL